MYNERMLVELGLFVLRLQVYMWMEDEMYAAFDWVQPSEQVQ